MSFAARFPALFHVTDRAALPGIREHGLLSARQLCRRHGVDDPALLRHNRTAWAAVGAAALRRQGMRDAVLRPRLDPAITCEAWRWFINGLVFLLPTETLARRFLRSEPTRDQVVLHFATQQLADAVALRTCRFNNGYIDRAPPATARKRRFDDYRPVADWAGSPVSEVVASDLIPPAVGFALLSPP